MSAAWPQVCNWLVTTLPTLAGWSTVTVYDGQPDTGDSPTDYATVGYTATGDVGGEYTEATSEDGTGLVEQGHVFVDVVCQSGDTSLSAVRTRCFALLDAFRVYATTDPTLGGLLSVNADIQMTVQPHNIKNQEGVAQAVVVTFGYYTAKWPN